MKVQPGTELITRMKDYKFKVHELQGNPYLNLDEHAIHKLLKGEATIDWLLEK